MKNVKEIITRSIILMCISDRCSLEKSIINGRPYSKTQREEQRIAIYQWLQNKGYTQSITNNEKLLLEQEVGSVSKDTISYNQFQYEAIEPCLWAVGLVKKLSDYDNFVLDDFHPVLQIGKDHAIERVLKCCNLKNVEEIQLQNEISILWHWRTVERNNPIFKTQPVHAIVTSIHGSRYKHVLEYIQRFKDGQHDFVVNNKLFSELSNEEQRRVYLIAMWRHQAFEWIVGDNTWTNVEINT